MKELSIEEKAQRYDEAISMAKKFCTPDSNNTNLKATLEMIFPELKESKDERIRKQLIVLVKSSLAHTDEEINEMIAWLEKQGEPIEINPTEFDTRLQALIGKFDSLPNEILIGSLSFWLNVVQNDGTYKKQSEQKPVMEGTFVNVDEVREDFMQEVYRVLDVDPTNDRANQIIDAFDHLPTIIIQKPVDKVEPKFKVGDTVTVKPMSCHGKVFKGEPFKIVDIIEDNYVSDDGKVYSISLQDGWELVEQKPDDNVEPKFHKGEWIIGDKDNTVHQVKAAIRNVSNGKAVIDGFMGSTNIFPATKEQHDALEKAMADAGYTFDFEKKELKEIKPDEWSEECCINQLIVFCENCMVQDNNAKKCVSFLKSLKDRVQHQPRQEWKQENTGYLTDFENAMMHIGDSFFGQYAGLDPSDTNAIKEQANILLELISSKEWSEEDKNRINRLIAYFEDKESFTAEDDVVYANWLKNLKDRVQPKQEWSEEDEERLNSIIESYKDLLRDYKACHDVDYIPYNSDTVIRNVVDDVNFLKSLKERYTWKPSDRQMKAIEHICDGNCNVDLDILDSIYRDFKKLREE